ncbi:MAG: O-antigen ligase family protein, partial [Pseudomonadota bacterium]|nr:O-antigen ligase family protein [Pseudomonadota bacterium]
MLSTSLQPLIAFALVPGLIFFALPAYRAGNDPLVLTGAAAALSLCLLTVSLPRVRGRALHLILPLGLIVLVQLLALGANSLGCAPPVAAATAADLSAPQWFPCTLRFGNSLYALLQTWVVIASGLLGFAVAGRVPVGRFNAVLVFAALVFGGLGAVRMVFDPIVLPGSAGFVNPNSLSTLLVVALLCWMQQSSGPVLDHLRSGRFIAVTGPLLLGLLLVVALVMTQSRLGMFVGLCACGLLVLVELGRRMTRYQLLHLATLLVVLALAVVALQAVAWLNRVGDIHGSLLSRLSIYEQGAQLWLKGIVFGVGAGTFEVVLPVVNTDPVL